MIIFTGLRSLIEASRMSDLKHYFWTTVQFTGRYGSCLRAAAVTVSMVVGACAFCHEIIAESKTHGFISLVRDISLFRGDLAGLGLATWRSVVADRQARTADEAKLHARPHQAMESPKTENLVWT